MGFVEFKIYISLKRGNVGSHRQYSFVEFKIYISLKPIHIKIIILEGFVEFKIYISLKHGLGWCRRNFRFVEFKIYISLKPQIEILDSNFDFSELRFNCI